MRLKNLFETKKFGTDIIILSSMMLTSLPDGIPREVTKNFNCNNNKLTSLEGAPQLVGGDFWCNKNELTSLEGAPQSVDGVFWCNNNELTSLKREEIQHIKKIGAGFMCADNPIRSHILGLMMISIGGEIKTELGDGEDVDAILNKWKNQGRKGVLGARRELLDLGYNQLAQL